MGGGGASGGTPARAAGTGYVGAVPAARPVPAVALFVALSSLLSPGVLLYGCSAGGGLPLVINEVHADPVEFVEIVNVGDAPVSLQNVTLTDSDADGEPIAADRAPMPAIGLGPGERLVVILGQDVSDGVLRTGTIDCEIVGLTDCVHAAFRLRSGEGETVYLQNGEVVVDVVEVPPSATTPEQTYCRTPDGTGSFGPCVASPGEVNP